MNLTKCLLASLCISAMTASAGMWPQENSFEDGTFYGVWTAPQVAIVDGSTGVSVKPIPGATDTRVLQLATDGTTWTNTVDALFAGEGAPAALYIDMLAKFVPSEELPPVDGSVKMALAVTNDLLAVTVDSANGYGGVNTWVVTEKVINTSMWYRVTVMLSYVEGLPKATVKIDQNEVSVNGATSFFITDNNADGKLNGIGFSGTGFIDEVVVTDIDPFGGGSSTVPFGGTGLPVDKAELDAWKLANLITGTEDPLSFDAFVMNVKPETDGTSPVLFVASIAVGGDVTVTVQAKYADGTLLPLGSPLNNGGAITILGKAELSDPSWSDPIAWTADEFGLHVAPGANKFFRVVITNGLVL